MTNLVQLERVSRRYGDVVALDDVSLSIDSGRIVGLLGPNGAGKTTTVRILATLLKPDAGTAVVLGHDVVREARTVREKVSLTGQYASVDEDLTGRENLVFLARLWGFGGRAAGRPVRLPSPSSGRPWRGMQTSTADGVTSASHRKLEPKGLGEMSVQQTQALSMQWSPSAHSASDSQGPPILSITASRAPGSSSEARGACDATSVVSPSTGASMQRSALHVQPPRQSPSSRQAVFSSMSSGAPQPAARMRARNSVRKSFMVFSMVTVCAPPLRARPILGRKKVTTFR